MCRMNCFMWRLLCGLLLLNSVMSLYSYSNGTLGKLVISNMGDKPDVFVIGAAKSATTSFFDLLVTNPAICDKQKLKEPQFFSSAHGYKAGKDVYYDKLGVASCPDKLVVDGSPKYSREFPAALRLNASYTREQLKRKKFIFILREPVTRQFSWYEMRFRCCTEQMRGLKRKFVLTHAPKTYHKDLTPENSPERFYEAVTQNRLKFRKDEVCGGCCQEMNCLNVDDKYLIMPNATDYLNTFKKYVEKKVIPTSDGYYKQQILFWSTFIDRKQLFILNMQSLLKNTTDVMNRVQQFLGLPTNWGENVSLPRDNEAKVDVKLDCETFDALYRDYANANEGLYELINSPDSPPSQPYFPPFEDTRRKCVNMR